MGDVSTKEGVSKIKKEIESKEKCVCILVNNAGIAPGKTEVKGSSEELVDKLFDGTTEQEWLDVYQTNVVGPFLMSTAFLPLHPFRATSASHKVTLPTTLARVLRYI